MDPNASPRFDVPADVAWVDGAEFGHAEELYLTRLPSGDTVHLAGTARMIWIAAIDEADPAGAVGRLVGRERAEVECAVNQFIETMLRARWLAAGRS